MYNIVHANVVTRAAMDLTALLPDDQWNLISDFILDPKTGWRDGCRLTANFAVCRCSQQFHLLCEEIRVCGGLTIAT